MQEAWITLQCPDCEAHWEAQVGELSAPDTDFDCDACDAVHPLAEFTQTKRDLEVLQEFAG
jgi:hypothetical protein